MKKRTTIRTPTVNQRESPTAEPGRRSPAPRAVMTLIAFLTLALIVAGCDAHADPRAAAYKEAVQEARYDIDDSNDGASAIAQFRALGTYRDSRQWVARLVHRACAYHASDARSAADDASVPSDFSDARHELSAARRYGPCRELTTAVRYVQRRHAEVVATVREIDRESKAFDQEVAQGTPGSGGAGSATSSGGAGGLPGGPDIHVHGYHAPHFNPGVSIGMHGVHAHW